jgi:hypothetical protein
MAFGFLGGVVYNLSNILIGPAVISVAPLHAVR